MAVQRTLPAKQITLNMALAVDSISFDAVRVALNLVANMQRLEMTARFFIQRLEQSGISEQRRQTVSKIDYQALREAAERAIPAMERLLMLPADDDLLSEQELKDYGVDIDALNAFKFLAGPETVLALLDERERNQQYIKSRDQENEEIALTVGKLLIENGRLVADTLRHLADNEIDSDYFAITSTNENGTEIDHEMAITDYALQAAGTVDELVAALESAEKRIAELEAREISLPERSSMLHRTDFHDDYQTVMAYKVSEVIDAIRATGIRINGGE
ncbi:ead/Ea22-like family protein [Escherichia coli]|uniref:ead/Ea22-like family protein n=1 Tax=Escherichia coli TaxID=562 RepID=UPI003D8052A1